MSLLALCAPPAIACVVYALLDAIPSSWIAAVARWCGAQGSDGLSVKGLFHSLGMGAGAMLAWWLELQLALQEPARSFACSPAASRLHAVLPQVELGYALYDLLCALRLWNWTFVVHGLLATTMLLLLSAMDVAHHLSRVMVVHVSTVFLHMRRVNCGARLNMWIDGMFAASFCLLRLVLLPWWWMLFLAHAQATSPESWGGCMRGGAVVVAAVVGGGVLHMLNGYWGFLIVLKALHKLKGGGLRASDGLGRDSIESDKRR
ncbi:hypothetical protein AB1Y20_010622 [Prymnesium parvum]|uniref:TLC domain-containing protein n=1 Tax=Prymnesium parvum TaxID=97485 RepID=A0AB34IRK4_PRYPA